MKDNQRNTHILASKHEHSYMFESSEHKSKDEKTKKKLLWMCTLCEYILNFKSILKVEQSLSQYKQYEIIQAKIWTGQNQKSVQIKFIKIGYFLSISIQEIKGT